MLYPAELGAQVVVTAAKSPMDGRSVQGRRGLLVPGGGTFYGFGGRRAPRQMSAVARAKRVSPVRATSAVQASSAAARETPASTHVRYAALSRGNGTAARA